MTLFLMLAAVFAILDWIAVGINRRRLEYIAKPTAMLCLILWYATTLPAVPSTAGNWFLLGLGLFLTGDIFLLMPPVHFVKGLLAFLMGYIVYTAAFNLPQPAFHPLALLFLAGIGALGYFLVRKMVRALRAQKLESVIGPLLVYAVVLGLTFYSALATFLRPDWPHRAAILAAIGGALCILTDTLFAWSRYIKPVPHGRLLTTISYHIAQLLLATAFLLFQNLLVL